MRRLSIAAVLAALLVAGTGGRAAADGPCVFGTMFGGNCLKLFPLMHQHGPLYNYGPYYGYPPFEPYGNWNAYLQYTGPTYPQGGTGNMYGWVFQNHAWAQGHGQLLHRPILPTLHHGHKSTGCSSCGAAAAAYATAGNAVERFNGVGAAAASSAFYAETPNLLAPRGGVVPVALWSW